MAGKACWFIDPSQKQCLSPTYITAVLCMEPSNGFPLGQGPDSLPGPNLIHTTLSLLQPQGHCTCSKTLFMHMTTLGRSSTGVGVSAYIDHCVFQVIESCLTHSRCSINTYGVNVEHDITHISTSFYLDLSSNLSSLECSSKSSLSSVTL